MRVFDAEDGLEFASCLALAGRPVTADQISLLVTMSERSIEGRWVETSPLPTRDPGVLDLLIRFEPRTSAAAPPTRADGANDQM